MNGRVCSDILLKDDKAIYSVETDSGTYLVITSGKQAVLDAVFLRDGMRIMIEGDVICDTIRPDKLVIDLKTEVQTHEDQ